MAKAPKKKQPAPSVFAPPNPKTRRELLIRRLLEADKARDDLVAFTKFVMPDPAHVDDVRYSQYLPARHHYIIGAAMEEVEKGNFRRLIINVPPRHGKTELASKKFIAWYAGRRPHESMIFGTYNEKYASDVGRAVRDIMRSPYYGQVFPETRLKDDSQATDRLQMEDGGILAFVGRGGTTTGRGAHTLIIDDPIKDRQEANSPTIREQCWTWFTQVVGTRMMDKNARIVLIQTRWHEDDIVGRLTDPSNDFYDPDEAKNWKIIDLPALAFENDPLGRSPGDALWPERFDEQFLQEQQRRDPVGFSALYQGRPSPDGGTFFQAGWLKTYKPNELPKNLRYYVASDHAVSLEQNRDKTCLIPVGVDENDNIYILPDVWWRQADAPTAVEGMLSLIRKYKPVYWWAEKTHISKSIGPFLRKRMQEEGLYAAILEITPVNDKQTRAQSIQGRMSMGKVFFPERAIWWPQARDELMKFPNAQHDDFVDALAYIGLGMSYLIGAAPAVREFRGYKPGTFGALKRESDAARRRQNMTRSIGGW
jgi:predicted phage terminase large subunit-like protein